MSEELGKNTTERVTEGVLHGIILTFFTVIAETIEHHKGLTAVAAVGVGATAYYFYWRRKHKPKKKHVHHARKRVVHHQDKV